MNHRRRTWAPCVATGDEYVVGITTRLAHMIGWTDDQVAALHPGRSTVTHLKNPSGTV